MGYAGITPAYAGKRASRPTGRSGAWDHPRVCGEKPYSLDVLKGGEGSPPRMRGKAQPGQRGPGWQRITPAYAGKRWVRVPVRLKTWDHPRVCGEKARPCIAPPPRRGSPPRMRGKGHYIKADYTPVGITPAYAGKRLKRSHSIGHFSCILCLFHSVLHRASVSDGSRAWPCAPPCLPAQNAVPV